VTIREWLWSRQFALCILLGFMGGMIYHYGQWGARFGYTIEVYPRIEVAKTSVMSCMEIDCAGGAMWQALDFQTNRCDFDQFRIDIEAETAKGRWVWLGCTNSSGVKAWHLLAKGTKL
jgi:hypothetical protein